MPEENTTASIPEDKMDIFSNWAIISRAIDNYGFQVKAGRVDGNIFEWYAGLSMLFDNIKSFIEAEQDGKHKVELIQTGFDFAGHALNPYQRTMPGSENELRTVVDALTAVQRSIFEIRNKIFIKMNRSPTFK
jgi:hypothetical protein